MNKTNLSDAPPTCGESVFDQEQLDALRAALVAGHGEGPGLEEKFARLTEWAVGVCVGSVVLDFMLGGMFTVDVEPNGELAFRAVEKIKERLS